MSHTLRTTWNVAVLVPLLLMMIIPVVSPSSNEEYYFGVMQLDTPDYQADNYQLTLVISNPSSSKTLNAEVKPSEVSKSDKSIAKLGTEIVSIDSTYNLQGASKHTKHVQVKCKAPVKKCFIQVRVEYVSGSHSIGGGFTLRPKDELGKEYVVATHCVTGNCIILVTSLKDDDNVDVKLNINPTTSKADYNGAQYGNGDTISERLDKGESMQVMCQQCDLTGTMVTSTENEGVVVLAGGDFTQLEASDADGHKDMVIEQMLPITSLGRRYILGQLATPTNFSNGNIEVIKVVPAETGDTKIYFDNACYTTSEPMTFSRSSSDVSKILSDKPVLVAQFLRTGVDYAQHGLVMNVHVPFRSWENEYDSAYTPALDTTDSAYERVYLSAVSDGSAAQDLSTSPSSGSTITGYDTKSSNGLYMVQFTTAKLRSVQSAGNKDFSAYIVHDRKGRSLSFSVRDEFTSVSGSGNSASEKLEEACAAITTPAATTPAATTPAATTPAATTPVATTPAATTPAATTPAATTPAATTPAATTPAATTPAATTPAATTPAATTPAATTPAATTPAATTPAATTPAATTPVATTPAATTPAATTPAATTPAATTPAATTPVATTPAATTPVATTPAATTPAATTPAATTPAATTPAATTPVATTPAATTPVATTPAATTPAATTPAATTPAATTPAATTPAATTPAATTPAATTPAATTPVATTPAATTPAATTPAATTPVATTPAATTPVATTPAATTPAATTPAATTPAATTPAATTPVATTPAATTPVATTPAATTPVATTPAATAPAATTPAATTPAATTPAATTTTTTTTASSPSPGKRRILACCHCAKNQPQAAQTPAEAEQQKEEAKAAIKKELTVDKKGLSASVRKKESSQDDRVSAQVIGASLGITIFTLVFAFLVSFDMIHFAQFVLAWIKKRRKLARPTSRKQSRDPGELEMPTIVRQDWNNQPGPDGGEGDAPSTGLPAVCSADSAQLEDCEDEEDRER